MSLGTHKGHGGPVERQTKQAGGSCRLCLLGRPESTAGPDHAMPGVSQTAVSGPESALSVALATRLLGFREL